MSSTVYILYSHSQDRYYVGHTKDVTDRITRHNQGRSKATKGGQPWTLEYTETLATRSEAMQREQTIKAQKSRKFIEQLIQSE